MSRVAVVPLTEAKDVRGGGWVEMSARPQRPVRIVGVMLEQRRSMTLLESELYQAGLDAMEEAKGKLGIERERLVEAARRLHEESEACRSWVAPADFHVTGFYVGVTSILLSAEPLSATLLVQMAKEAKQLAMEPVMVGMDVRLMLVNVGQHGDVNPTRDIRGALLCEVVS